MRQSFAAVNDGRHGDVDRMPRCASDYAVSKPYGTDKADTRGQRVWRPDRAIHDGGVA